jgi:hypothetical protein
MSFAVGTIIEVRKKYKEQQTQVDAKLSYMKRERAARMFMTIGKAKIK